MHMVLPLVHEIQRVLAGRQGCSTHEPSYTLEPDLKVTRCWLHAIQYCRLCTQSLLRVHEGRPGSMICATTLTMTRSSLLPGTGLASRPPTNHSRLSAGRTLVSQGGERLARFLRLTFAFRHCRVARGMREIY